jgi:hypothetical protein
LTENELNTSIEEKEANERELAEQQGKLDEIASQYEKLKTLLDQKGYSRARRENTRRTPEHITSRTSSFRYRRHQETKNVFGVHPWGRRSFIAWCLGFDSSKCPKRTDGQPYWQI